MPYIPKETQEIIDELLAPLLLCIGDMTEGEINYTITRIILETNPEKYKDHEKIMGRLLCIALEYYRRKMGPYEDSKITKENDVYAM